MPPSRTSVLGVLTTIEAIVQLMFAVFLILNAYCYIDMFQNSMIGVFIKIMYLHDPDLCGNRINIGEFVDEMVNQAFVVLQDAPVTYYRTLFFLWANFFVAIFWLISNELMFRNFTSCPWTTVTLAACLLDFSGLLFYLNDYYSTMNLSDLLWYIGASGYGTGNVLLDTRNVAPTMAILISKGTLFIVINCVLITSQSARRNRNLHVAAPAVRPRSPLNFVGDSFSQISHRLPRPNLSRNEVFVNTLKLQDMEAACSPEYDSPPLPGYSRTDIATVLPHPDPTTTPERPQRAFSAEDLRTIRVPDTILSLPQRLEKLIAEEAREFEILSTDSSENRVGGPSGRNEDSETGDIGLEHVYFPELLLTPPMEFKQNVTHQTQRRLDTYTNQVQTSNPLTASLPNLTDEKLQLEKTTKFNLENEASLLAEKSGRGAAASRGQPGYNSRLRKQLRPRTDLRRSDITGQAETMFKKAFDHLGWTGSGTTRRLVFFSSQRKQPDVLY
ncbi:PREDICTED: uncharacterized protein LOC106126489 isoform X2 [Papilio xuthus]|uniref:Uncharacterized protein LOC106126489 isoform X2 n=1 Tax=Papilio xuthus TaxID=66420 RepID=A0AAJ6ZUU6_PAPXU|nr:PREDICTED: uncharacterized protein LOC106126489 isoform X2 [Papilio xuthus]